MEYEERRRLQDIAPLLLRLDRGETLTAEEQAELAAIRVLDADYWDYELPNSLGTLVNLDSLSLRETQISHLAPLEGLKRLQWLSINNSWISDIAPLTGLTALEYLDLGGTQISDLSPLARLISLETLSLWNTDVWDLRPLSGLAKLKTLVLMSTCVHDLIPLAGMSELESLYLNFSRISDLKPLMGLVSLKALGLSGTGVSDLSPLFALEQLEFIDLSGCRLRAIPHYVYERCGTKQLGLEGTTLSTQPISIFREGDEAIRAYYDAGKVPVREAKVIFLGDGGAGKTHTIRRILQKGSDDGIDTDVTLGISIDRYDVEDKGFHINFWDFGGQENMHAMHRCFLTERTLYVVVLNSRWDLDDQARRWLDNIRAFAPDSPVILAVNLWEGVHRYAMDTGRILRDYPNVFIHAYAAKGVDRGGFRALTALIEEKAEALDSCSMELPEDWAAVLEELREKGKQKPVPGEKYKGYIDKSEYLKICGQHGLGGEKNESIRSWLLEWFNDLGVCFSYHRDQQTRRELDAYKVLEPRWLTGAIYYLINQKESIGDNGHVDHYTIRNLLKYADPEELREGGDRGYILPDVRYQPEECGYILQVMRKFGLSFEIEGKAQEFIPALCSGETPDGLRPAAWNDCVSYEFRYRFLPDSVVQRLMVRLRKNWQFTKLWRRGFRYDDPHNGLITVADAGGGRDSLRLDVYSNKENRGWDVMLSLISRITAINAELNLKPEEYIIVRGDRGEIAAPADMILQAKQKGVRSLHLYSRENGLVERDVNEILGRTYSPGIISTAAAVAEADHRSLSETVSGVIHNHNIYGDIISNAAPGLLFGLLGKMVEQNIRINDRFVEHYLRQLEGSDDPEDKKVVEEARKEGKGGLLNLLKGIPKLAAGAKSTLEDSKAAAAIIKAALLAYGPQVIEGLQELLPPGLGG